jgi:hypothetical protein
LFFFDISAGLAQEANKKGKPTAFSAIKAGWSKLKSPGAGEVHRGLIKGGKS